MTEALALAKLMANSEVVPKEFKGKPANILVAMQMGAEVGLAPMQALQSIAVINGRPSLWGDAMLGLVQAHPEYEWHKEYFEGQEDGFTAVFVIKRKGHESATTKFSVRDAKVAKLWGKRGYNGQDTPWVTNPKRMLQLRARGFGLRDRFADALKGLKLAEESMDIAPDVSKKQVGEVPIDLGTIASSPEGNRGHGNEGMQVGEPPVPTSEAPKAEKVEDWICAECGEKNCHKKDCSHCAAWLESLKKGGAKPVSKPAGASSEAGQASADPQKTEGSKANVERTAVLVEKVEEAKGSGGKPYLKLSVKDRGGNDFFISCWHKTPRERLLKAAGKVCIFDLSSTEKGGRTYLNIEEVIEIQGEMEHGELAATDIGFPKPEEPDGENW